MRETILGAVIVFDESVTIKVATTVNNSGRRAPRAFLARSGHFFPAHLMQDLAWFRISVRIGLRALSCPQAGQQPFATSGASHSSSRAVTIPSRPKIVLNHGTPA
jgi:hypothetical protein